MFTVLVRNPRVEWKGFSPWTRDVFSGFIAKVASSATALVERGSGPSRDNANQVHPSSRA